MRHSILGPVLDSGVMGALSTDDDIPSLSGIFSSGERSPRSSIGSRGSARLSWPGLSVSSFHDHEKPLVSGHGINVYINLAEPIMFLQGFDHSNHVGHTVMLRGCLRIRVTKATKIKAITLKFKGKAITRWPEGIPPKKTEYEEVDTIMSHTWPFFNAQFPSAGTSTGADLVEYFPQKHAHSSSQSVDPDASTRTIRNRASFDIRRISSGGNLGSSRSEQKRLSLQVSSADIKDDSSSPRSPNVGPTVAQKGYKTFEPGEYVYNFELPLDSHVPESIHVDLGSVAYNLEVEVIRAGAFRTNLFGIRPVTLIRTPSEGSLEQVEPIAISKNWEDHLHYDIVISGKSFPLGNQIPIAFKLTPLSKVTCHRIKVLITENIEYWAHNKRVHRMEPVRKLLLFDKKAGSQSVSTYPGSTMRLISGGGLTYDQRQRVAQGEVIEQANNTTNLLGDLEGDGAPPIGPTEFELNVQLPNCGDLQQTNSESLRLPRIHFDTTYQNIQVHHWIKIVMRLSRPDSEDPNRRRHFEISIDSPFHILSCLAAQSNLSLPAYSSVDTAGGDNVIRLDSFCPGHECCCANRRRRGSFRGGGLHMDTNFIANLSDEHRPESRHGRTSRSSIDASSPRVLPVNSTNSIASPTVSTYSHRRSTSITPRNSIIFSHASVLSAGSSSSSEITTPAGPANSTVGSFPHPPEAAHISPNSSQSNRHHHQHHQSLNDARPSSPSTTSSATNIFLNNTSTLRPTAIDNRLRSVSNSPPRSANGEMSPTGSRFGAYDSPQSPTAQSPTSITHGASNGLIHDPANGNHSVLSLTSTATANSSNSSGSAHSNQNSNSSSSSTSSSSLTLGESSHHQSGNGGHHEHPHSTIPGDERGEPINDQAGNWNGDTAPNDSGSRPIHFIRQPSYNPPPFSTADSDPPPPLQTPPPEYDEVFPSPSTGLADYFQRLSDAYAVEDDAARTTSARASIDTMFSSRAASMPPTVRVNTSNQQQHSRLHSSSTNHDGEEASGQQHPHSHPGSTTHHHRSPLSTALSGLGLG